MTTLPVWLQNILAWFIVWLTEFFRWITQFLLVIAILCCASVADAGIFLHFGFTPGPASEAAAHRRQMSHERSMAKMQMSHERNMARYSRSSSYAPPRYMRTPIFNGNRAYFYQR